MAPAKAGELEKKDAEALFAGLYAFGIGGDGINAQYEVFDSLKDMRSVMDRADMLRDNGSYLEACDVYLTIGEDEPDYLDESRLFRGCAEPEARSFMNVTFSTGDEALDGEFVRGASVRGLLNLKGHRITGGMRASIYNAMPYEGVEKLVAFMKRFALENPRFDA